MEDKILPLGSVVYLKRIKTKIMIICRGAINEDEKGNEIYFDYTGCFLPNEFDPERLLFFNRENVEEVLFEGYVDDNERRLASVFLNWTKETTTPKGVI